MKQSDHAIWSSIMVKEICQIEKIQLAKQHRPFNTDTEAFRKFIQQQILKINQLSEAFPELDLDDELRYFTQFLSDFSHFFSIIHVKLIYKYISDSYVVIL